MPIEIRHKKTNEVQSNGIIGNSMACGHCDQPISGVWVALDTPYSCLVHEQCVTLFKFDQKARTRDGAGRKEIADHFDWMLKTLHNLSQQKWFQNDKRITPERKQAFQELLLTHQALRNAGVLSEDKPPPPEYAEAFERELAAERAVRDEREATNKRRAEVKAALAKAADDKDKAEEAGAKIIGTEPAKPKPKAFMYRGATKTELVK